MTSKIVLQDAYKGYTQDQDKIISPEETIARFEKKLKESRLDILEKAVRIDNGRLDIPVYFSVCTPQAAAATGTKKQMGKGATPAQAKASAVMELAERFSFFSFVQNPNNFTSGTLANFENKALPLEQIARSVQNTEIDPQICRQIFGMLDLKWTRAYNLTRQQSVWVPFDWFFAINEFNGPSAGNCQEEAISQGICEIVERHVSSIVSLQKMEVTGIDTRDATDQKVLEMLDKYHRNGIRLFLSDFSLKTGIPTVGAMAYDPGTFPEKSEIVWTAGTTPDPEKALSRALTEVAQLAGDFNTASNYVASGLPKYTELNQAAYIMEPSRTVSIRDLPNLSNDNIRIEIENMLQTLATQEMDVILIDTRHPLLDVPAFYTIVPGAHFRERSLGTSVAMFAAKLIVEKEPVQNALQKLTEIDRLLPDKYYLQFYMGQCHLNNQDPRTALTYFDKAAGMDPHQQELPSIYSYAGVCLKDLGNYQGALEILEKARKLDPERTDVFNLKGFCYFKLKDHAQAIENFKQVIKLNPGSAIDYANIATNYREMGETTKAIAFYETALDIDPGIEFAQDNLARLKAAKKGEKA